MPAPRNRSRAATTSARPWPSRWQIGAALAGRERVPALEVRDVEIELAAELPGKTVLAGGQRAHIVARSLDVLAAEDDDGPVGLEADPSLLRLELAGDEAKQGALPCPVLADQAGPAVGENRARGIEQRKGVMVGERHPVESNAGHGELPERKARIRPGRFSAQQGVGNGLRSAWSWGAAVTARGVDTSETGVGQLARDSRAVPSPRPRPSPAWVTESPVRRTILARAEFRDRACGGLQQGGKHSQ